MKKNILLITQIFSKRYSAPAIRWNVFIRHLKSEFNFIIIEFPNDIGPWNYKVVMKYVDSLNTKLYSIINYPRIKISDLEFRLFELVANKSIYGLLYGSLINRLDEIIKNECIDLAIASVPPFHTGILAYYLYKKYQIPYIIDVRDLIEYFYFYQEFKNMNILGKALRINTIYKNYVRAIEHASVLTTVTPVFKKILELTYKKRVYLLPNGITVSPENIIHYSKRPKQLVILEAAKKGLGGNLGIKTIVKAWANEVIKKFPEYKLLVIGDIVEVVRNLFDTIPKNIVLVGRIPFDDVIKILSMSRGCIIWCLDSDNPAYTGAVPVKFYDSIGTGMPVYAQGPNSYLSLLIKSYHLGEYVYDKYKCDYNLLANSLIKFIENIEKGLYDFENILNVRRKFLRINYISTLKRIIENIIY